jgi:hypothetical protein
MRAIKRKSLKENHIREEDKNPLEKRGINKLTKINIGLSESL